MAVIPYRVNGDKVIRLNAVSPLIEGGRVHIPKEAPWLDDFMDEAQSFPNGKHDDQIDALSMGLDALSRMAGINSDMMNVPIQMSASLNANFKQWDNTFDDDKEWLDKARSNADNKWNNWGEL